MSDSADSSSVRFFSLPHALRAYCDRCFKAKSKFRCTGCQAVVYCSKECQKAARRTHKPVCTTEPNANFELQATDLGYPSPLALSNALDEWIEIQRWCLYTLTCALVQLEGGVDAVLAAQKGLVLHVVPAHRSEHDGSPAMAFRFGHAVIADKDSDGFLRENWKDICATVEHAHVSSALAFLAAGERNERLATPLGSFPVVYFVYRTNLASCHTFTLFHLPLRHVAGNSKDEDAAADGRTRAACEELVHVMKELLCSKIVYRRAENPRRGPEPDWGIYERTGTGGCGRGRQTRRCQIAHPA
ncbi:hypothetical protein LXA43DRAFT_1134335 [Ganoderma leucocontextum]|nr:hypothetical protein LXA43DRAFT_1134335 [Ganoderma leucocontextum]